MAGKRKDWERNVARLFRGRFPDAQLGLPDKDPPQCSIEGTPFRIRTVRQRSIPYADILAELMGTKREGERQHDDRPAIVVSKQQGREPLVHTTLDGLLQIVERHFWRPDEEGELLFFPLEEGD